MYIVYQFRGFIQSVTEKVTCLNSLFYMEDSNVESAVSSNANLPHVVTPFCHVFPAFIFVEFWLFFSRL